MQNKEWPIRKKLERARVLDTIAGRGSPGSWPGREPRIPGEEVVVVRRAATFGVLLVLALGGGARAQDHLAWIGQRVVLRSSAVLTADGRVSRVERAASRAGQISSLPVYRVVESEGPRLWIIGPEGVPAAERRKGWAQADQAELIGMAVVELTHEIRKGASGRADLYLRRGSLLAVTRNMARSRADLDESIRIDADNPVAFHVRGNIRADLQDLDGAILDFSEAIRLDPGFGPAFDDRAHTRYLKGEYAQAVADLDAVIRLKPDSGLAALYRDRGDSRRLVGDADGAVEDLTEAVRRDRGDVLAYALLARAESARGQQDRAIAHCNTALRLEPAVKLPCLYRGLAHDSKGESLRAAADFEEGSQHMTGAQIPPGRNNRDWRGMFAASWRARVDLARAVEAHSAVLHVAPAATGSYFGRAEAYVWWERYDDAIADFSRYIEARPQAVRAHLEKGLVLLWKKDYDRAIADLTGALRGGRDNDAARLVRGQAWVGRGDYDKALDDYTRAIGGRTGDAWAFLLRARAWAYHGDTARAVADQTEAIRLLPNYPQANRDRAWLEATSPDDGIRRGQRAVASATRACGLVEWAQPDYLVTLAAALAESGDFARAIAWQEDAVDLLADESTRAEAQACLDLYRAKKPFRTRFRNPWPGALAKTPELPEISVFVPQIAP
jgi:tetratricopeptide (TPR) repeat protein